MFRWFRPLRTQQTHVSMFAIIAINLLWFSNMFQVFVTSNALAFTVKKFTDDTRLIALATSIGYGFSFLIGPACNYLSDRIWTRLGRRRPFIIIGWTAVAIAMAILPMMPSYGALVSLIVVYTLLGDMGTPLEPLCMEVVPPQQRSRSMSTRLILIQIATLIYFQVLFPRFDQVMHLPDTIPLIGGLSFTGERLIYSITSGLFFLMVAFLLFGIKEEKVATAPNIALKELRFTPVKSTWTFLVETFGDRRWLWIYMLYCSGNAFFATWTNSPLYTLLLTDQFGFAKANIGLMGLPSQLIGVTLLLPLMGWFGD
jgi:Na+/melibiose symporter-like transporter